MKVVGLRILVKGEGDQRVYVGIRYPAFNVICGFVALSYISDLLTPYIPSRGLRSSNQSLLVVPRSIQKSCGDRAFAVAAPRLWNALSIHMRQPGFSLAAFKKCLKTYLFKNAFFFFKYFVISYDFCLNCLLLF